MRPPVLELAALAALAFPSTAHGHLELTSPTSRYGGNVLKVGPCGVAGGGRSQNVFTFRAGETITVSWNEYIDHPGHYRVAFDDDGDDDFVDPACTAGCNTRNPTIEMFSNGTVLLDGISDRIGGDYSVDVTLPDVACTNCTLQVIQVMYDKPPYTSPGNDIYYQCVDMILVRDPDEGGCICAARPARGLGPLLLGLLTTGAWLRLRRRGGDPGPRG